MKIMLVGDDRDELDVRAFMLRRERFSVVEAATAEQAMRRFEIDRPDLVVVDLSLAPPGALEVLRAIRAGNRTPVLVIAGLEDRRDVVGCFELGADDFITKPFVFRELSLRIGAILRRASVPTREPPDTIIEIGDFRLDPETNEVTRGSVEIRLTPTEFRIFYRLAQNAGHVVPARRLFGSVWGDRVGDINSLRSHICHLRKKLDLDGGAHGAISNMPAVGYVLETFVGSAGSSDERIADAARVATGAKH